MSIGYAEMEGPSRRSEYAQSTRAAILEAALERFTTDGSAAASIDSIAERARVTKGAVYHHFHDKAALFEAVFLMLEERLLSKVGTRVGSVDDPWMMIEVGVETFLQECCEVSFRRIVLEEGPVALGWLRWKELEERYFLGLIVAALELLAPGDAANSSHQLNGRMVLAAMGEAGLSVAASTSPEADRARATALVMRLVHGVVDTRASDTA